MPGVLHRPNSYSVERCDGVCHQPNHKCLPIEKDMVDVPVISEHVSKFEIELKSVQMIYRFSMNQDLRPSIKG